MKILLTGGSGFVGTRLIETLLDAGHTIRVATRRPVADDPDVEAWTVGDIALPIDWRQALVGVDAVIHLAARVHVMKRDASDNVYFATNQHATTALVEQAGRSDVKRFIFLSTAKVYGEGSHGGHRFSEAQTLNPQGPYAKSKAAAERDLRRAGDTSSMSISVIRTPVVYGPGVGGNISRLLQLVRWRAPLPFKGVDNQRSIISVNNLSSAIQTIVEQRIRPGYAAYNVADFSDISTQTLVRRFADGMQRSANLLPAPAQLVRAASTLGMAPYMQRLWGDFQLDASRLRREFGWSAPYDQGSELAHTARHYLTQTRRKA